MVILTEPFAPPNLVMWLAQSKHPVMDGPLTQEQVEGLADMGYPSLNVVSPEDAIARLNAGERLYTSTENALEWVLENVEDGPLTRGIRMCKDKEAFRAALAGTSAGIFSQAYSFEELRKVKPKELPLPVVLKPSVGFCSVGVYVVRTQADWKRAMKDIRARAGEWAKRYPQSVVGTQRFLVEEYVAGQEFALDAYYAADGTARILNIFQHDFSNAKDTKDRLYWTSVDLLRAKGNLFAQWMDSANAALGLRDFAVHIELRVAEDGRIVPIEFNPLRFAGLGGTDLAWYGYGFITAYEYLSGEDHGISAESDVEEFFASVGVDPADSHVYSMSLLEIPPQFSTNVTFDWDAFLENITGVLGTYMFTAGRHGALGFVFKESTAETLGELAFLRDVDLVPYVQDHMLRSVAFRLPDYQAKQLSARAAEYGMSRQAYLQWLVEANLEAAGE